jgi:K+-sensing histidine kinase KdpD
MTDDRRSALFPTILASTVHDIKNALATLLELAQRLRQKPLLGEDADLRQLEFEAIRINQSLMQLLVTYKVDQNAFGLMVDDYAAIDVLEEVLAQQCGLLALKSLQCSLDCADDLLCYCDFQYLSHVLASVLDNALRYSHRAVLMTAYEEAGYVVFAIEDDGDGYPDGLLKTDWQQPLSSDGVGGHTGLGLFFAAMIAGLHRNGSRYGTIRLDNQSRLGGARFRLFLP